MKLFDLRLFVFIATTVLVGIAVAHWYGNELANANPNGIWLYTPLDETSQPDPAYPIGFGFAGFCVFAATLVPPIFLALLSRLKSASSIRLAKQFMLNTVASGVIFLVASQLVR